MMIEKAKIIKLDKDKILVSCSSGSQCKNCSMCSSGGKKREINVLNPENIELHEGDEVMINLPVSQTIFSSFMVLIFPLLMFILLYFLSGKIENAGEGLRALFGLSGMFIAFVLSFVISRIMKKTFMPSIKSKLIN